MEISASLSARCLIPLVYLAELSYHIVGIGAGIGDNRTWVQGRKNSGLQLSVLCLEGGGAADEALSALGEIGSHYEIQLSAGSADVLDSGGLGAYLAKEVNVDSVVDGHKIIQLRNYAHIVGIADRSAHAGRVVIQIIV